MNESEKIIQWLKTHEAIRLTVIEDAAKIPSRTLQRALEGRGIPDHHIEALIKELKKYGYK